MRVTMHAIDLNSDVGESFGRWSLGDDDRDDCARSPVPTSPADSTPAIRASSGLPARRPRRPASWSAPTSVTAIWRGSAAGTWTSIRGELADDVVYQIGALQALAATAGARVRYVKPHGGLYNAIVHHTAQARAVVEAVKSVDPGLPILGLPGSEVLRLAEAVRAPRSLRSLRRPGLQPGRHTGLPLPARLRARGPGHGGRPCPPNDRRRTHPRH